jgi:hypothetical protein
MSSDIHHEQHDERLEYRNASQSNEQEDELTKQNDKDTAEQPSEDEAKLYKDLFAFYDVDNNGYISIETFIAITKEKIDEEEVCEEKKKKKRTCPLSAQKLQDPNKQSMVFFYRTYFIIPLFKTR